MNSAPVYLFCVSMAAVKPELYKTRSITRRLDSMHEMQSRDNGWQISGTVIFIYLFMWSHSLT